MAKYRSPEYCPQCGKVLQAIHDNIPGFVGDTFKGYKPCDHVQNNPTASIEERAKDYADSKFPNPNPVDAPYATTGDRWDDISDAYKSGFIAGSSQGSEGGAVEFLNHIREYERESHNLIVFDERSSEELYQLFIKSKQK